MIKIINGNVFLIKLLVISKALLVSWVLCLSRGLVLTISLISLGCDYDENN